MAQQNPQKQSTAIVTAPASLQTQKIASLAALFEEKKESIAAVVPRHVTPARMIKIVLSAVSRSPDIIACTRNSIFLAVIQASELGLEFGNTLGHAYLVPYKNKKRNNELEAIFIPGYRGLISLARRSGQILSLESRMVHEKDYFDMRLGLDPKLDHVPFFDGDPGKVRLGYALSVLRDGAKHIEPMSLTDLEKIRQRSPAAGSGPWVTDTEEMYRKTLVRRIFKYLPMSVEMAKAAEYSDIVDEKGSPDFSDVLGDAAPELEATPPEELSAAEKAKALMAARVTTQVHEATPAGAEVPRGRQPGED